MKGTSRGMAGLSGCRIVDVTGPDRLLIHCEGQEWPVEHLYFDGHIASVVKQDFEVDWILLEQADPSAMDKSSCRIAGRAAPPGPARG